jgi:hypothetical protein
MAENCARPRCGHRLDYHRGSGCFHFDAQPGKHCSCPSFRTQAQQEAWEWAKESLAPGPYRDGPLGIGDREDVLVTLLELYP